MLFSAMNSLKNEERLKAMLKDLGRSTLRGIRRCYKCGTLNGTRGLSCKNKACDVIFSEAGRKKKNSVEVCKLHTSSSPQVFSVRVREKGPDFRGFVQLPAGQESNLDEGDSSYLSPVTSLCFVESCQRLFNTKILECHEKGFTPPSALCQHVQSARRCCSDATLLPIDSKALQSLNTSQQVKDTIWELNSESAPSSIVQRVSKCIMAVKCKVTTKHPLGFLHITFSAYFQRSKDKDVGYVCTCTAFKGNVKPYDSSKNCIHYYACVAAFASDEKLSQEFSHFVLREKAPETYTIEIDPNDDDARVEILEILNDALNSNSAVVLSKDDANNFILPPDIEEDLDGLSSIVDVTSVLDAGLDPVSLTPVIARLQDYSTPKTKMIKPKKKKKITYAAKRREKTVKKETASHYQSPDGFSSSGGSPYQEQVNWHFIEWLSSVTERINQTMHIQLNGKPEPLVFHIPQRYFDCLKERLTAPLSAVDQKKLLPNLTMPYLRKDSPPFGTFQRETWQVSNLAHAKAIFNTHLVSLKETRSFIQKADGSYEDVDVAFLAEGLTKRDGDRSIRPAAQLKTFLKIGNVVPHQSTPSVLTILWTPNLYPLTQVGELQIIFEFTHSTSVPFLEFK